MNFGEGSARQSGSPNHSLEKKRYLGPSCSRRHPSIRITELIRQGGGGRGLNAALVGRAS
jgi:hypothetical protein